MISFATRGPPPPLVAHCLDRRSLLLGDARDREDAPVPGIVERLEELGDRMALISMQDIQGRAVPLSLPVPTPLSLPIAATSMSDL